MGTVALAMSVIACGDDSTGARGASDYCAASLALETAPEPDIDFETATPEEMTAAIRSYATETFLPLAQQLRETAAEEVLPDIDIGIAALNTLAETGDFDSALGAPEVEAALERLHAHDLETCEWNSVAVAAADYAFQGVPSELDAGVTSFEFENGGTEVHEMVLFRINDGVTETVEELLALPEEEAEQKATMVAAAGAAPGDSEYAVADLSAGSYAMLCFVPEGTTSEETEGSGPPHFTRGMVFELEVN
jgi:hypothetical protein